MKTATDVNKTLNLFLDYKCIIPLNVETSYWTEFLKKGIKVSIIIITIYENVLVQYPCA